MTTNRAMHVRKHAVLSREVANGNYWDLILESNDVSLGHLFELGSRDTYTKIGEDCDEESKNDRKEERERKKGTKKGNKAKATTNVMCIALSLCIVI